MNDLVVVEKFVQGQRLKALVHDSVSSPITGRAGALIWAASEATISWALPAVTGF
jgi:hypothetical protein